MKKELTIYSAPLQGYTDHVWRNAHAAVFGGIDVYCAPFACIEHGKMRNKDIKDIAPGNNAVDTLMPQILAGKPENVKTLAEHIKHAGYSHIDINLGCPHPPVALKHQGSGMLKFPDEMGIMFESLKQIEGVTYSIKTRLGWDDETQWNNLLQHIDLLSPTHITVHPRIGKQGYAGEINTSQFKEFLEHCHYPVVYNGNIESSDDIDAITECFPALKGVMVGRALVASPHIFTHKAITVDSLRSFHDMLLDGYGHKLTGGDSQLLNKMKSLWQLFLPEADRKARKAIKKSNKLSQYIIAANDAINSIDFTQNLK